jgi:hypothetical protein
MMNTNYAPEIATANQFVIDHKYDIKLQAMLREAAYSKYSHSERWSMIYDYIVENYPGATGTVVTGLAYWCEK